MQTLTKIRVLPGQKYTLTIGYSEVCMFMRIAGKVMQAELVGENSVQLFDMTGAPFSFPITVGEAGFYRDDEGLYLTPERCATVGCRDNATGTLAYRETDREVFERVCAECGEEYGRRPVLRASFTPDA